MDKTYESRSPGLKRAAEEVEKGSRKVKLAQKFGSTWEYLEKLKELQELESKIKLTKKWLEVKEAYNPDLKALRGNVDHQVRDDFWEVEFDTGIKRSLAGKSYEDAKEKFLKKSKAEKANAEKQKSEASAKKVKMETE